MYVQFGYQMNIHLRLDVSSFGHLKNVFRNFSMMLQYFIRFMTIYRIYSFRNGVQIHVRKNILKSFFVYVVVFFCVLKKNLSKNIDNYSKVEKFQKIFIHG